MTSTFAAAYERISDDREGQERGVERQRQDNVTLAGRHGCTIVRHFTDNDIGASTKSRKKRPEYNAMLQAVEAGEVQMILAYSNSRLTRRPLEFEQLIQIHERTGVLIKTMVSGDDDLSTADGRMMARMKAVVDAREAEVTGERVARQHKANRDAGIPVGGARPFGWRDDKRTLEPAEAKMMRKLVDLIIAGESLRSATRKLNEAGFKTTLGNVWRYQNFTQYLRNPRLVGLRTYKKQVVHDEHGSPVVGQWEPLLGQDTWDRLQLVLARPEVRGRIPRRESRRYFLTGIVRCATCNGLMYGNARGRSAAGTPQHRYVCDGTDSPNPHSLGVAGYNLDHLVGRLVMLKMGEGANVEAAPKRWDGEARAQEVESLVAQLLDQLGQGKISPERIFGQVEKFETELSDLRSQRGQWLARTVGPVVGRQLTSSEWDALDVSVQRGFAERHLEAVYIKPLEAGRKQWDESRVVPVWRDRLPPTA